MTIAKGTRVDRYVIEGTIGAGSMGDVLLAIDVDLNRKVAIKILSERHRANKELQGRFFREGRAVAAISHSSVVQVFSTGTFEERPYIAMEFLDGIDLQSYVERNGPMGAQLAASIAADAARGLQAAAEAGLIHRDVKPSNLVLLENGRLKVTDFGLAKPLDPKSEPALTALGVVVGTPDYIAPEQARGDTLDEAVDIYALGGTLFFLVTGKPPFRKGNPNDDKYLKVVARHLRDPAPDPRARVPMLDNELADLILQLMVKQPQDRPRYPTLIAKLEAIANRLANAPASGFKPKLPSQPAPTPFMGGEHRYQQPHGKRPSTEPSPASSASRTLLHTPAAPISVQQPPPQTPPPATPVNPRTTRPGTPSPVPSLAGPSTPVPAPSHLDRGQPGSAPPIVSRAASVDPVAARAGTDGPGSRPQRGQQDILRASQKVPIDELPMGRRPRWPLLALTIVAAAVLALGVALKLGGDGASEASATPPAPADAAPPADATVATAADAAIEAPPGMTLIAGPSGPFFIDREPVNRRDYLAIFPKQKPGGSGPDAAVTRVSRTYAIEFARGRGARLATVAELMAARASKDCASTGLHEWTSDNEGSRPLALSPQGKPVARKDRGYSDQTFRLVRDLPKKKN